MTTEELEQIRKIIREETVSPNDLKAAEERLTQKIDASQEDTINVLRELIQTGYEMHEKRIRKLEDDLSIPHPKEN
jgi:type II secretory pathway component PulL